MEPTIFLMGAHAASAPHFWQSSSNLVAGWHRWGEWQAEPHLACHVVERQGTKAWLGVPGLVRALSNTLRRRTAKRWSDLRSSCQ